MIYRKKTEQVLKENEYQESIISKIFKRTTNSHSLDQLQQLTQATDIKEEEIRDTVQKLYLFCLQKFGL